MEDAVQANHGAHGVRLGHGGLVLGDHEARGQGEQGDQGQQHHVCVTSQLVCALCYCSLMWAIFKESKEIILRILIFYLLLYNILIILRTP